MATWRDLELELDQWSSRGETAKVWWRDDDAVSATPAVRRLVALAERHAVPLALAVVPNGLSRDLSPTIAESTANIVILQHGIAHQNHAPSGQKKQELTAAAGLDLLRQGLGDGRSRLEQAFGSSFLHVQVPPWNRIDSTVEALLSDLGFVGLSTFARYNSLQGPRVLPTFDCHLDIFHWQPTRSFRGQDELLNELVRVLAEAREALVGPVLPFGIMTHHHWHEESCWQFLDRLYSCLTNHPAVRFLSASDALKAATLMRRSEAPEQGGHS